MESIQVGIRYQPLEILGPAVANTTNEEEAIEIKHWVLVFTPPSKEFAFTFEAMPGEDKRKTICMPVTNHMRSHSAFPLGTYYGQWDDLIEILEAHPQRGSEYSSCFNNCQHFVAIYLMFLEAFANSVSKRGIRIDQPKRYDRLRQILRNASQGRVWNEPNIAVGAMLFTPIPLGGLAGVGALVAAEATTTTTVSAGGLAGFFGMTTTTVVPAAYAGFAACCAPIALGFTSCASAAYLWNKAKWKTNTSFTNPLICGFPFAARLPLRARECSFPKSTPDGHKMTLSSSKTVHVSAPVLMGSYDDALLPQAIRMAGASSLYEIVQELHRASSSSGAIDPGSFFMFSSSR
ncbi:hypothetical protein M408DRAFT_19936 [Serendipita vermifera MAFF 305830]|uniref:PPPDE domain-containing protein n=1 Tax=Serendipita vermifera MAFF 305830 TaxID=933852 RepID=A0A0C2XXV8_SERVB|nr:hypothetical protein M408DRAFT_19936 [Serendipita vermifera MAFF 305830]